MQALYATTGIIGSSSLAVAQNGTPNMSVNIAAGWAAILGTSTSTQGVYVAYNDATANAAIATAPSVNSRIDLVCLTVSDAYYSGTLNQVAVNVVTGTAAASPTVPATPANSIALAQIAVGTNVTSIVTANITDLRVNTTTNLPVVTLTGTQTLTNKTLTTPIISSISNTGLLTLPTSTDTIVGRATTDTLTNKTLTAPIVTVSVNAQTGTTYTTVLSDNTSIITLSNAASISVTIPPNSSVAYAVGTQLNFAQYGTGQVTISGGSGVTIVSTGGTAASPKLRAQYASASAIQTSANNWLVVGDIS
jgi:hypothetical protein